METRIGRLRSRWLVLLLGGILLATTVLVGGAGNAEAQSQGKAKRQGQAQGQENGTANGLGHQKVAVCHKPANETANETEDEEPGEETAEEKGHILYLPPPAAAAHERHGDKELKTDENGIASSGECGTSGTESLSGEPEECLAAGTAVEVEKGQGNNLETVEQDDVLTITGDFELTASGTVSVTLRDADEQLVKFVNGDNVAEDEVAATITEENGTLRIAVKEDVPDLSTTGLEVDSSEGITCPKSEETSAPATLTGTIAPTTSGDPVLKTKNGKAVRLEGETEGKKTRLEKIAKSKPKVEFEVKGAKTKKGKALKVTSLKKK